MADIGFRYPTFAPATENGYVDGSAPQYGTGVMIGKGISGSISWNKSDEHMYGDDVEIETDTTITGGSLTLEVDDVDDDTYCTIFGLTKGSDGTIIDTDESAPYGGFGYLKVKRKKGVRSFVGNWIYKVQFSHADDAMQTKADRVTFGSTSLDATILGAYINETGSASFRERKTFADEESALAWLKSKANIT